jgi:hypothetical protein
MIKIITSYESGNPTGIVVNILLLLFHISIYIKASTFGRLLLKVKSDQEL